MAKVRLEGLSDPTGAVPPVSDTVGAVPEALLVTVTVPLTTEPLPANATTMVQVAPTGNVEGVVGQVEVGSMANPLPVTVAIRFCRSEIGRAHV